MSEAQLTLAREALAAQTWPPSALRPEQCRRVSVVMDSDHAGRVAAERIAGDLRAAGVRGSIIDLAPGREDGYDLRLAL